MNIEKQYRIEKRDIAVIGASALGGFLLLFVLVVLKGKDAATALLAGLLLGAPGGAGGGVLACLFRRKSIPFKRKSILEFTNAGIRGYLIAATIIAGAIVLSTCFGRQPEWLRWLQRLFVAGLLASFWYRALREFRRRRRGEAPRNSNDANA